MESILKITRKLLDTFILPKYDDIDEYHITFSSTQKLIEITFWMDGTEQEIEEEIVEDCHTFLDMVKPENQKIIYRFTTECDNFYTYS